ncbi:hypothetical protein P3L10_013916 [Capsicum annuum]
MSTRNNNYYSGRLFNSTMSTRKSRVSAKNKVIKVHNEITLMEQSSIPQSIEQVKNDLLTIVKYNYPKGRSTLFHACVGWISNIFGISHGVVFGAIQTNCISCDGILYYDGIDENDSYVYGCLNKKDGSIYIVAITYIVI